MAINFTSWRRKNIFFGILVFLLLSGSAQASTVVAEGATIAKADVAFDITTVNTCVGGAPVMFTHTSSAAGTWSVSNGGSIDPISGLFAPSLSGPGCFEATFTAADGVETASFVVFPAAPVFTLPESTCVDNFTLPVLTAVDGFQVQYSINNAAYDANPAMPNATGCHFITARYALSDACGDSAAGTSMTCATSAFAVTLTFPTISGIPGPANTCNEAFDLPALDPVTDFTLEYSIDGDFFTDNPDVPTEVGCHTVEARYVFNDVCGSKVTGRSAAGTICATSGIFNVVIFPPAPTISAPTIVCEGELTLPAVPTIDGFVVTYSIDEEEFSESPILSTESGCYEVVARYELENDCGTIAKDTEGEEPCGFSNEVQLSLLLNKPVAEECPESGDIGCITDEEDYGLDAPEWENGGDCDILMTGAIEGVAVNTGGCNWTITHKYWATNSCSLTSDTCYQTLIFSLDDEDPIISEMESLIILPCDSSIDPADLGMPTVSDNCGLAELDYDDDVQRSPSLCPQRFTIVRTWFAEDNCGNEVEFEQTIIVGEDLSTTCPDNVSLGACSTAAEITAAYNTWASGFMVTGCSETTNLSSIPPLPAFQCGVGFTLSFALTAADGCNKTPKSCSSTFSVAESTPLSVSCPDPVMLPSCTPEADILLAYNDWIAGFSNNSAGCSAQTPSTAPTLPTFVCGGAVSLTYDYSVTDDCGTKECSSTFEVAPIVPLSVSCPNPVTLPSCTPEADILLAYNGWIAGFTNNGGCNTQTPSTAPTLPTFVCGGAVSLTYDYSVTDDCGTKECSSTFEVAPMAPLSIDCPSNVSLSACATEAEIEAAYTTWAAGFVVSDGCNTNSNIASIPALPTFDCGAAISLAFTLSATEDCSSTALTCSSTFAVASMTPLSIDCPSDIRLTACATETEIEAAYTTWAAGFVVSDGCNTNSNITSIPALPTFDCGAAINLPFTLSATDDCNATALTCTSTFTVSSLPEIEITECPSTITVEGCGTDDILNGNLTGLAYSETSVIVTGAQFSAEGGEISRTCEHVISYVDAMVSNCPVEITRTWTVIDICMETTTCEQQILIYDTEGPNVICPSDITINCNDSYQPSFTGMATGSDDCDDNPIVTYADVHSALDVGFGYVITRTWTVTDVCGNETSCDQVITIVDCEFDITDPCVCLNNSSPIDLETGLGGDDGQFSELVAITGPNGSSITHNPAITFQILSSTGGVDAFGPLPVAPDHTAGTPIPVGLEFQYNVESGHYELPFYHYDAIGFSVTIGQFIDGVLVAELGPVSNNCIYPNPEIIPGIEDIYCPDDSAITLSGVDLGGLGSDNVSFIIDKLSVTTLNPSELGVGTYNILMYWDGAAGTNDGTGTAADPNQPGCVQTVFRSFDVDDVEAPVITCPADTVINCPAEAFSPDLLGMATATDNCNTEPVLTYSDVSTQAAEGCELNQYLIIRTWTATDGVGNESTCEQTIMVQDTIAPLNAGPEDFVVQIDYCEETALVEFDDPTATDNCDPAPLVENISGIVSGTMLPAGVYPIQYLTTDACGNQSEFTIRITVLDPPSLLCSANATAILDAETCSATVSAADLIQGTTVGGIENLLITYELIEAYHVHDASEISGEGQGEITLTVPGRYRYNIGCADDNFPDQCWNYFSIEDKAAPVCAVAGDAEPTTTVCGVANLPDPSGVDDLATEIVSCTVLEKYGEDALEPWFDQLELLDDSTTGTISDFADCSDLNQLFVYTTSRDIDCDDLTDWGVTIPTGWRVCKVYTRTWEVTDWTGLKSESCSQDVLVVSPTGNATMILIDDKIEASCTDEDLPSGNPYFLDLEPTADGRLRTCPSTSGLKVEITEGSEFCKIGVTMTMSENVEICGNGEDCSTAYKKIIHWNVIDGCTNDKIYDDFIQVLEVYDKAGPSIEDKKAWITGQPFDCVSTLNASFTATDDCSTITSYEINVSYDMPSGHLIGGGLVSRTYNGSSLELDDIPNGVVVTVTFIAYDCCGNSSEMSEIVTTTDESDPVCIVDDELVVSLIKADYHNDENELVHAVGARLDAASVSEGSQDNCFTVGYEIRHVSSNGDIVQDFAPYLDFTYTDALEGKDDCDRIEWIDLKVYEDRNGNGQYDDDERYTICPSKITLVDVTEPMSSGDECISYDCTDRIPNIAAPTITWDPSGCSSIDFVSDDTESFHCPELVNCDGEMVYVLSKRTIIHRMTKITEHTDYTQDITQVVYEKEIEDVVITLPWDLKVECNSTYDPGTVTIDNQGCSEWQMSGPKIKDYSFTDAASSICGTITYEYQFMNSCIMNRWEQANSTQVNQNSVSQLIDKSSFDVNADGKILNNGIDTQVILDESSAGLEDGFFTYVQVIKVLDNESPTATVSDTSYCATSGDCSGGVVVFNVNAEDGCSAAAITDWFINEDDDNNHGFVKDEDEFRGANLTKGTYELNYKIEDQCGNAVWLTTSSEVLWDDCKKPTIICLAALAPIMENGSVMLSASTLVTSLDDNCTSSSILSDNLRAFVPTDENNDDIINGDDIEIGIENNQGESTVTLTCQEYGFSSVPTAVWTVDEEGNYQYCLTIIDIQAGSSGVCDRAFDSKVAGEIVNASDEMISDVTVNLSSTTFGLVNDLFDGFFNFSVPMHSSVSITPKKDINYLNGVSTGDLVLLQKHILGVETLSSAYQLIAADVSGDSKIDTRDMLHLSRLILGINNDLQSSDSWTFVAKDHQFANPTSPWGYPQEIVLDYMSSSERADFIGIKMGDLSGNAKPNNLLGTDMLPETFLRVEIMDKQLEPNKVTAIPFYANAESNVSGYQFTLALRDDVTFVSVTPGTLPRMNQGNFGEQMMKEGILTTYWAHEEPLSMNGEEVLFTINVIAGRALNISDVLSISSDVTAAEAYDENLEVMGVQQVFNGEVKGRLALHQNIPNPFSDETVIGFELPDTDDVLLVIRDVAGRTIKTISGSYSKGYNEIGFSTSDLKGMRGVFYYELRTSFGSPTKKMIIVD